ncbi:MAG: hypothetical protein HC866_10155 [Leptolyngbyaceae cyanobacterium RU_5_1]|nr:hypothetical protein [Leptolyngbyaceae cyanobacterium RU_5_1]
MKAVSTAVFATLATLSLVPTGVIANPVLPTLQPRPDALSKPMIKIPQMLPVTTVNGKISNNGGQPNFDCQQIKLYAAISSYIYR